MENVITFCKNKCCPVVIKRPNGQIVLGDSQGPEGVTIWTEQNFVDFLTAAKAGTFDSLVSTYLCPCGQKAASECYCMDLDVKAEKEICLCGKQEKEKCDIYCFEQKDV